MEQYKILVAPYFDKLENIVNQFLSIGWLLSGGVFVHSSERGMIGIYQAVYKPKA